MWRFLGRYDILNGGNMENAALFFSGGIQDIYCTDLAKHFSFKSQITSNYARQIFTFLQHQYKQVNAMLPNVDELFIILEYAIKRQNLVGAFTTFVNCFLLSGFFSFFLLQKNYTFPS
jgi:hypothetical protein